MTDPAEPDAIEEHKLARNSLFAISAYAESIFETAREPLLVLNEELRVVTANRAFLEFFHVSATETVGEFLFDLGSGQWNIPSLRDLLEKILPANGSLTDFEVSHDLEHLGHRIMLVNARRVHPTAGPGQGICIAIQDVTEKREAEVKLERLNEELEERIRQRTAELETANRELLTTNRELGAFSYSVSHDLRSPLRALDGYARILLEDHAPTFSAEAQEFVRDIRRVAQRMGQLIDDLLSFSRLSRQGLEKRLVAPAPIVRKILDDHHSEREARHIEVVVSELSRCHADPSLLKQVWVNLLSSAFKYTRKTELPRIEIGSRVQDGEQVYFVRDNGVGFDMRYADKLFGVFQRLHKAAEFDGTGVGLAIVQRIIHRHGGRIWAEAAVNQGATFSFSLPILENPS